jgi:hypothetical protein
MFRFPLATPTSIGTKRPACPKCGVMMGLARIEPHSAEYRKRTFECRRCDYSEGSLVRLT